MGFFARQSDRTTSSQLLLILLSVDVNSSISYVDNFISILMNMKGRDVSLPELHLNDGPSSIGFLTGHVDKRESIQKVNWLRVGAVPTDR